MTISEIITELESFTSPPPEKINYKKGPDARIVINEVLEIPERTAKFGNLNDEAIVSIIDYILNMFMIPLNLRGAHLTEPCTEYMLRRAFEKVKDKHSKSSSKNREINEVETIFKAVVKQWFQCLRQSKIIKIKTPPRIKAALPLSFHLTAYEESTREYNWKKTGSTRKLEPRLYEAFAYNFHLRIMNKVPQQGRDATKLLYERLPRYAFLYASMEMRENAHRIDEHPKELVKDWLTNFHKSGEGEEAKIASTASIGYAKLWPLFWNMTTIKARSYYVRRASVHDGLPETVESPDGSADERKSKGVEISHVLQGLVDDEADDISPYEPPLEASPDYYGTADKIGDIATGKSKALPEGAADFIHSRNVSAFWDFDVLSLYHYAFLYEAIEKAKSSEKEEARALVLYFLILIHTGIDPRDLQDLMVLGKYSTDWSLDLTQIGNQYYILIPSMVKLKSLPAHADTYSTAKKVHVPVPPAIAELIPQRPADKLYIFSFKDNQNRLTRLSNDQILPLLQQINDDYGLAVKDCQHGLNITLECIATSFYSLYCDLFGFDPYMACHISKRDHKTRYGAKLHYVHIPHAMLEKQYLKTFDEVDFQIRLHMFNSMQSGTIRWKGATLPQKRTSPFSANVLDGYGSCVVSKLPYVKDHIEKLRDGVINERDRIKRHNLFSVYLYLAFQFATTLRPHEDPQLYWVQYNRNAGVVTISDKQSGKYNEQRTLVLPQLIRNLLNGMQDGWSETHRYIMINRCLSYQNEKTEQIFFSISDDGTFVDFTYDNMRNAFKAVGLEFTDAMNMPRHYTRNYLYHNNVSHEIADILMGHQSAGREVFNLVSTTSLARAASVYLPVLDKMLDELGFTQVEYLP